MIYIVAKNRVKPECIGQFKEIAAELVKKSQAEKGCIFYKLCEDINDPAVLTFIECWESQEIIDKHNVSEHFTRLVPQLGPLCAPNGKTEVSLYKVALG